MVSENGSRIFRRNILFKVLKAAVKGVLFYALYYVCWLLLAPAASMIPGLQKSIETFLTVYITLIVLGELMAGTVYQHFFSVANALFMISYLVFSLNSPIISVTYESIVLMVDLHILIVAAMLLSLLGLGRSMLQVINFMSKKAEQTPI